MEPNDEVVERQKLVDVETEEDVTNSAPKSATPASPMAMPKINIKSISSGDSRNSASCSIERSEKIGHTSAKVTYINERRPRPHLHGTHDERFEFKSRPRKLLKDSFDNSINDITHLSSGSDTPSDESTTNIDEVLTLQSKQHTAIINNNNNNDYNNICTINLSQPFAASKIVSSAAASVAIATGAKHHNGIFSGETDEGGGGGGGVGIGGGSGQHHKINNNNNSSSTNSSGGGAHYHSHVGVIANTRRKPSLSTGTGTGVSVSAGYPGLMSSMNTSNNLSDKFDQRPIKHHSFVSEVPDVKHMERALLGLLDDFHSGKLKAFGSGCTMDQMTKIREQQESLAKLHFELAASEEDSLDNGNDFNAAKAQENMLQLMQRLEQLSISIEQLQTSHTGL